MEPTIQNTFIFILHLTRISFFATTSADLHKLVIRHFKINFVEDYCALLIPMTTRDNFDERACDQISRKLLIFWLRIHSYSISLMEVFQKNILQTL